MPEALSETADETVSKVQRENPRLHSSLKHVRQQLHELTELACQVGEPEERLLAKALASYEDAWEAEHQGNRVAILNPENEILPELCGFGPPVAEVAPGPGK
jgi:hypothetical protein